MKSKNVLLVSQYFSGGGLERMVHLLGASLKSDFDCNVIHFSFDQNVDQNTLLNFEKKYNIKSESIKKTKGFSLKVLLKLIQLIRLNNIDVIHTNETAALMYASFAKLICFFLPIKNFKIIHTQHSFIHLQTHKRLRHYDRFFSKFANVMTVVSEKLRREYEEIGIPKEKIKFIPNGVELPKNELSAAQKNQERESLIEELADQSIKATLKNHINSLWILNLARVHPKKGQDNVIQIWNSLEESIRKNAILIFVGPETFEGEKSRLLKMVKSSPDSDRIFFTGNTDQPIRWMQASDVFISASEYEGMPLSPFEAIGAGIPTLLSDIAGHQTLKEFSSQFDYKDPNSAAQLLSHWVKLKIDSPIKFESINKKNAESVRENFSIKKMSENYYQLYYPVQRNLTQLK